MEDYTYHLDPAGPLVLGAHMLEICPSLAAEKPSCEIHPLGIGGKADPVRLVFTAPAGPAVNAAMIDLGDRFRLLLNEVDVVAPPQPLPKLPVARAFWKPRPDLKTAAAAWIYAGGPHHTVFSQAVTSEQIEDFAEILGVECLKIDGQSQVGDIKNQLRWNEAYYGMNCTDDTFRPNVSAMATLDWVMIGGYFTLLLGVAWWVVRKSKDTAADYFLAGRNLGWWIIGASIFASNIGSEHVVGLAGSGAKDGVAMAHYELHAWCLLVLAWVFVPFYARSHGLHHAGVPGKAVLASARATCSRSSR